MKLEKKSNKQKRNSEKNQGLIQWLDEHHGAVTAVSTFILVVITAGYTWWNYELLLISTDPVIELMGDPSNIESNYQIKAESEGIFNFILKNDGIAPIKNIQISSNLLRRGVDGSLYAPQVINSIPTQRIEYINTNDQNTLKVDLNDQLKNLEKESGLRIVRIRIKYQRALDGKTFNYNRTYLLSGSNNYLIDNESYEVPLDQLYISSLQRQESQN